MRKIAAPSAKESPVCCIGNALDRRNPHAPLVRSSGYMPSGWHHPSAIALPLLNRGVGVVIMDTFVIFRFDLVPSHVGMGVELQGDVADQVFDEYRVFVGALGDGFFIFPF